jgi:hypothetical protein
MSDEVKEIPEKERLKACPRPQCCDKVKFAVYFSVDPLDQWNGPGWYVSPNKENLTYDERDELIGMELEAEYCPFCGAEMPDIVKRGDPPEPLAVPNDGHTHCETCGERIRSCCCHYPSAAYKVKD